MNEIQDIKNAITTLKLFKDSKGTKNGGFVEFGYCDLAIEALKEKAEREKGCEICKIIKFVDSFPNDEKTPPLNFCPNCGKKLNKQRFERISL